MWEIYHRKVPYEGYDLSTIVLKAVAEKMRPVIAPECPKELADLMKKCWDENPDVRPEMEQVIKTLQKMNFSS
jgi:hypothetical protein